jgi:Flp pilus assembly protein TadG
MIDRTRAGVLAGRDGQSIIEFAVVTVITVIMLLFIVETGRMLLVYTSVANAARAGLRYAIVHGNSRAAGATVNNASGPAGNPAQVLSVIRNFAAAGALTTSLLIVSVTYPGSSNAPGQNVKITVVYPYDPLTTYFTKSLLLGTATQGVIVY